MNVSRRIRGAILLGILAAVFLGFTSQVQALTTTVIDVLVDPQNSEFPHEFRWNMLFGTSGGVEDIPVSAVGSTTFGFDSRGAFDFGTLANPLAPPRGETTHTIETEMLSMDLVGSSPVFDGGDFQVRLDPTRRSFGGMTVVNTGTLSGDSFFDVFFEIVVTATGDVLRNESALRLEGSFIGVPELDVLWPPFFLTSVNTPALYDSVDTIHAVTVVNVRTEIPGMAWVPLPAAVWMALPLLGSLGVAGAIRRRRRAA